MKAYWITFVLMVALHAGAAEVQGVDDAGRRLTLAEPARRIVSLAPHLTELLFAAGAGDRVVGVSAWSDFPEAAKRLPRIGDSNLLDLERIVALKPDLVVAWGNGSSAQQLARLRAAGLPVWISESRSLAHIAVTLRTFGRLAGSSAVADPRAAAFESRLAELKARYSGRRELAIFYQVWHQPLLTIGGGHPISEALRVCGARSVFGALTAITPAVDAEAVLQADPDAIVTGSVDPAGPDHLDRWRGLRSLRAAREGRLIVVDPDTLHRPTDRMIDGIETLCLKLDRLR